MKILYDIALLGRGHYDIRSRTGIYRVVENIALGLANAEGLDLSFCASLSLENENQAADYLRGNQSLGHIPLISLGFAQSFHERLGGKILKILNKPKTEFTISALRKSGKVLRESISHARRVADQSIQKLDAEALSALDLFHSPFYSFPEQVPLAKSIKKIITIYDLIPVIYPKFFEFNHGSHVEKVIHQLKPQDWVICVSHATKNDLCNYQNSIDPSRVFVTHLAASELFYPCCNSEEITIVKKKFQIPDVPYILSLNTLEPRKNIAHTIRCFVKLVEQEKIKDLCLVIVGRKGWGYDDIFNEQSNFAFLKERIIITGYVANEYLAALYSGAIAFVFPSFYEGFGLPPLEAMQCGVPVITSNVSSLPEVVGDAGIMISPSDADGFCQAMLEIYHNSSLRKEMSGKSIEQAKKFSWEKCTQETIRIYKTVLNA